MEREEEEGGGEGGKVKYCKEGSFKYRSVTHTLHSQSMAILI